MRHLTLLLTLSLAALSSTATSAPAAVPLRANGVVLSVSADRHALRIVEEQKVVDAAFRGSLPAAVDPGAQIAFSIVGQRASRATVSGHVDHVLVSGTVVRQGKLLALRLSDGSLLTIARNRHLRVGSFAHIGVSFTPARGSSPSKGAPGTSTTPEASCAKANCTFDVTGTVTAVDDTSGAITVTPTSGGAPLTADPGTLDTGSVFVGDFVHLSGTQDAATGSYTITTLDELPGCDTPDCTVTLDGTVDDLQPTSVTVADDLGDEYPMAATAAQLSAISLGDTVHVVATQDPTTGSYKLGTIAEIPAG